MIDEKSVESSAKLTPQYVDDLDLSLNPIKRHQQVRDILLDPEMVGADTKVLINPGAYGAEKKTTVIVSPVSRFLGKRALKKAATYIERVNLGDNNGEDF